MRVWSKVSGFVPLLRCDDDREIMEMVTRPLVVVVIGIIIIIVHCGGVV